MESQINAALNTKLNSTSWLRRGINSRAGQAAEEIETLKAQYDKLSQAIQTNQSMVATNTGKPTAGPERAQKGEVGTNQLFRMQQEVRNRIIYAMLAHVRAYHECNYDDLYEGVSLAETVTDFSVLALGGAGAIAGGTTARIMSGISAGMVGAKSALKANYLNDLNKFTLITRMKSIRVRKLTEIKKSMTKDCAEYPLDKAVKDVQDLLEDGSLRDAAVKEANEAVADLKNALEAQEPRSDTKKK